MQQLVCFVLYLSVNMPPCALFYVVLMHCFNMYMHVYVSVHMHMCVMYMSEYIVLCIQLCYYIHYPCMFAYARKD